MDKRYPSSQKNSIFYSKDLPFFKKNEANNFSKFLSKQAQIHNSHDKNNRKQMQISKSSDRFIINEDSLQFRRNMRPGIGYYNIDNCLSITKQRTPFYGIKEDSEQIKQKKQKQIQLQQKASQEDLSQCTFQPVKAEELHKQFILKLPKNPLTTIKVKIQNMEKLIEDEKQLQQGKYINKQIRYNGDEFQEFNKKLKGLKQRAKQVRNKLIQLPDKLMQDVQNLYVKQQQQIENNYKLMWN
eukprot:TRINITY_DN35256_c0_g1_i1.p1 TRINITY_DN35256_c0_g1~~TRINITY_DN35256_c0_g1_i1.p1  ORF type:complete len:241 (-),score=40.56 TRINITY_DN35256_c0_g1_i1:113-835(-)